MHGFRQWNIAQILRPKSFKSAVMGTGDDYNHSFHGAGVKKQSKI